MSKIPGLCGPEDAVYSTALYSIAAFAPIAVAGTATPLLMFLVAGMFWRDRMLVSAWHDRQHSKSVNDVKPTPLLEASKGYSATAISDTDPESEPEKQMTPASVDLEPNVVHRTQPVTRNPWNEESIPLLSLLNTPYVAIVGGSRSGKTTLATALSIARYKAGNDVYFATTDNDIPSFYSDLEKKISYTNDVAGYITFLGTDEYKELVDQMVDHINGSDVGGLSNMSVHLDELLALCDAGVDLGPLITAITTRGPKVGIKIITNSHTDTVSSHGLPSGYSAALARDRVFIEAIRVRLADGTYKPSGSYRVTFPGESPVVWSWPQWMLDYAGGILAALEQFEPQRDAMI